MFKWSENQCFVLCYRNKFETIKKQTLSANQGKRALSHLFEFITFSVQNEKELYVRSAWKQCIVSPRPILFYIIYYMFKSFAVVPRDSEKRNEEGIDKS